MARARKLIQSALLLTLTVHALQLPLGRFVPGTLPHLWAAVLGGLCLSLVPHPRLRRGLLALFTTALACLAFYLPLYLFLRIPVMLVCGAISVLSLRQGLSTHPACLSLTGILWLILSPLIASAILFVTGDRAGLGRMLAVFPAHIVLALALQNQTALQTGTAGRAGLSVPRPVKAGNRGLLALLLLSGVALYFIGPIKDFLASLFRMLGVGIVWVIGFLGSLFQTTPLPESPEGPGDMGMLGLGEAAPSSPFWDMLEKIVVALAQIALIPLILFLLYKARKPLLRLLRLLMGRLRLLNQSLGGEYQDEKESLGKLSSLSRQAARKMWKAVASLRPPPRYGQLSPDEKLRHWVRGMYKRALPQNPSLPFRTAREEADALSGERDWVEPYERARYSNLPITPGDIESARRAARK